MDETRHVEHMSCLSYHSTALQGIYSLWFRVLKTCVCMFIWDYSYVIWKANGLVLNHADGKIYLTFLLKRHRNRSRLTAVSIKQLLRRVTNILFNYSHKDTTVPFFCFVFILIKWTTNNTCIIRAFPLRILKLLQPAVNFLHSHLQTGRLGHFRLFVVTRRSRLLSFSVSSFTVFFAHVLFS